MSSPTKEKTSPKLLTAYAPGKVRCQMSWYMVNSYLNLFYTDIVGLTGVAITIIVATARSVGSSVIGIILSAAVPKVMLKFSVNPIINPVTGEPSADAHGYLMAAVIASVAMIPVFWLCAAGCKEKYTNELHSSAPAEKTSFLQNLKSLVQNDQLLMVILVIVAGTICVTGRYGILTYYVIYVVGSFELIGPVFTSMTIGQLVGTLTVPFGTKIFGKKGYMIIMNVIMATGFALLFFFPSNNKLVICGLSFL